MKKTLFAFTTTVFSIICILNSISYSAQYWSKTYGGDKIDEAKSVLQTLDGGYILAGQTGSFGDEGGDFWLLKLDEKGDIIWQKTYGGDEGNYLSSFQETSDGGYILVGNSHIGGLVIKFDSNVDIVWQRAYGETILDLKFESIEEVSGGGYIIAGFTDSFGAGDYDVLIIRLASNGDVLWQRTYGRVGSQRVSRYAQNILLSSDGGFIVAAQHRSTGVDSYSNLWVFKLDDIGNIAWEKSYGGIWDDDGVSIQLTSDGGYILSSRTLSFTNDYSDIWVLKLASEGDIIWQKAYDYGDQAINGGDYAGPIIQTSDGGYILLNHSMDGPLDYNWVLKLHSDGEAAWQKIYSPSNYGWLESIQQTPDGGYIVAGFTDYLGAGLADFLLLKLTSDGDIPNCSSIYSCDVIVSDTDVVAVSPNYPAYTQSTSFDVSETSIVPEDSSAIIFVDCCYDPADNDFDCVHIESDNCPNTYNPDQLDTYPPQGNEIGNACDCEGNFDCDGDCDGTDASTFKIDFGRNTFGDPCESGNPCNGDFDCDNDCDGTDAALFKVDFGRSSFNNPCPACVVGDWCEYTTTTTTATCTEDGEGCIYSSECCNGCCCSETGGYCGFPVYCQCVPTIICEDLAGNQCQ